MTAILLKKTKVSLVTISPTGEMNARQPALAVFLPLEDVNINVLQKDDEKTYAQMPAYTMTDIQPASQKPTDTRVKVFFTASGTDSENPQQYYFLMEVQYLALMMTLNAMGDSEAGGLPLFFVDSDMYKASTKIVLEPTQASFMAILPFKESEESIDFSDKLEELVKKDYTAPLAPITWDEVSHTHEQSPLIRIAQSRLLMILLGLARGEVTSLTDLIDMESHLDNIEEESAMNEEAGVEAELLVLCVTVARNAYRKIANLNPELQTAIQNADNMPATEYDPQVDKDFFDIISSHDMDELSNNMKIKAQDKAPEEIKRDENVELWNESILDTDSSTIKPLIEFIEQKDNADEYRDILDIDFLDSETVKEKVETHGLGKVFTSLCIAIAVYSLKKGLIINNNHGLQVPPPVLLNDWANVFEDEFVWELPALTDSLKNYSFNNAVDVFTMYFEPSQDISDAVYLWSTMHAIGHHIASSEQWENYTAERFAQELDVLENHTQQFIDFKSWFLRYYRKINENAQMMEAKGESDDACPVFNAIQEFVSADMNVYEMARTVAMAFPVLADLLAIQHGHSLGDEEWDTERTVYIRELLTEIAYSLGGRIKLAIR